MRRGLKVPPATNLVLRVIVVQKAKKETKAKKVPKGTKVLGVMMAPQENKVTAVILENKVMLDYPADKVNKEILEKAPASSKEMALLTLAKEKLTISITISLAVSSTALKPTAAGELDLHYNLKTAIYEENIYDRSCGDYGAHRCTL